MSRYINPKPQYKPNSTLEFFESNTNTPKIVYKDVELTIPHPLVVPTDSNGFVPNIWFSGSAKVLVFDNLGQQYLDADPVGSDELLGAFSSWESLVTYNIGDIVVGSNGLYYVSFVNNNLNKDPISTPTSWEEIRFLGMWNINKQYQIGVVTQTPDGNLWKAITINTGNNPSDDDGTNWETPEVKPTITNTVISHFYRNR